MFMVIVHSNVDCASISLVCKKNKKQKTAQHLASLSTDVSRLKVMFYKEKQSLPHFNAYSLFPIQFGSSAHLCG